ncbi:nucleoside triphosphate pyrophosphohydrolase [Treponema sp.]|uniref:nucleoside triphosphate pyrophosphohydrolase n=1 Tax=Treponema sp. TaxID=166 RepID=UPI00298DC489|nr:nucleoside triphosphate pyrophosphohydrolase [Treponema sp.]MCR5613253.1 nucleoside triphosphate pyrophosphohydrolase [Treponema sp.]
MPDFDLVLKGEFNTAQKAFERLYNVVKILRCPEGCPWDKEQTPLSMRRDLIEEVFEAVDAITQEDSLHAKEELGDVMLNATMISYMYEQRGDFTVAQVLNELAEKLIRRHPHVFPESEGRSEANSPVKNGEQVLSQWDRIKENVEGRKTDCILDEVPRGFPPLLRAYKMQKKAAKKGFDWDNLEDVKAKITEELLEVEEARVARDEAKNLQDAKVFEMKSSKKADDAQKALEGEIGDLLFAVVNYARHLGVDPETALNSTNEKFYKRFSYVQKRMKETGQEMVSGKLDEMDKFWNEAKEKAL